MLKVSKCPIIYACNTLYENYLFLSVAWMVGRLLDTWTLPPKSKAGKHLRHFTIGHSLDTLCLTSETALSSKEDVSRNMDYLPCLETWHDKCNV